MNKVIENEHDEDGRSLATTGKYLVNIIIIVIGLIFMPSIKNTFTAFFNPDWYVFNELLMKLIQ